MQCIVVTPERTLYDQPADFVALTLFDGEIGIAPGHTPLIGRLGCGELRIRGEARTDHFYVEGGFVEVLGDVVTVLTPRAAPASEIDAAVVQEQLDSSQARRATSPELAALRDRAVQQSRAQLRVARRAAVPVPPGEG
jgi:F-type H+-transporting ATPase subunit epsilon